MSRPRVARQQRHHHGPEPRVRDRQGRRVAHTASLLASKPTTRNTASVDGLQRWWMPSPRQTRKKTHVPPRPGALHASIPQRTSRLLPPRPNPLHCRPSQGRPPHAPQIVTFPPQLIVMSNQDHRRPGRSHHVSSRRRLSISSRPKHTATHAVFSSQPASSHPSRKVVPRIWTSRSSALP